MKENRTSAHRLPRHTLTVGERELDNMEAVALKIKRFLD